jgi:serine/threonine-protein kinase
MANDPRELSDFAAALRGQYTIERELGRGGMGIVYLANDLKLDRRVAIKTLPGHLAHDEKMRERFLREARTAAALSHPNIVPIHRADEIDGHVFFVMGFVDGESVAQRVGGGGPMSPGEVVRVMREVAGALHEAHTRGIIHRDVKAENILIDRVTGRAMVTDFGIARLAEATPLTVTGLVLGTVQYMSPEHVSGEAVDARSDVYSLGIVAFYALTGIFPFVSESPYAVLVAHVTKPAPRVREIGPEIPAALAKIVDRCLAKDPGARFPSCIELSEALAETADVRGLSAADPRRQVAAVSDRGALTERGEAPAARPLTDPAVLLSDTEARAVWDRAARLQEQTKAFAAPDLRALARTDRSQPVSQSSAFRLDVVRESAREAGIATEFVDRALVEHGHLPARVDDRRSVATASSGASPPAASLLVRDVQGDTPTRWTGAPSAIEYEVALDGEMPEDDFDWVVETIRRTLGDVGIASTVGHSMSWSSADPKRQINVTVHVRGGRTTITVSERLRQFRNEVFGAWVGGLGGGLAGPAIALSWRLAESPVLAAGAALAVFVSLYGATRHFFGSTIRERRRALRELTERVSAEAESSIRDLAASKSASYLPARRTLTREGT